MPKSKKRVSSTRKKTRKKTKKSSSKSSSKSSRKKSKPRTTSRSKNIEKVLIENFVSFQKVMLNLSEKFAELNGKISQLLELFEVSAKTLAEKDIKYTRSDETREFIEKMNTLLDQNKTIARGLTLMHEMISPETHENKIPSSYPKMKMAPIRPKTPEGSMNHSPAVSTASGKEMQKSVRGVGMLNLEGYEKSIPTGGDKQDAQSSMLEKPGDADKKSVQENE